jgi:S1-C subfamily serine protease
MSDEEPGPTVSRDRDRDDGRGGVGASLGWMLPLALTGLVVVLAWKLYESTPRDVRDSNAQTRPITARGDLAADEKSTVELFRAASPAVVQVTNLARGTVWTGAGETEVPQGTGSGFVWDAKGYVVTNFHVVEGGNAFTVTFADHSVFDAVHVGHDEVHDLAVLKLDPQGKALPALPVGTSRDLLVGQKVFAIGNPFGLDQTLTTGIISGVGREIMTPVGTPLQGVIQTDAAINPGNSGGPLLDSAGRVIGMNTQITSPSGASAGVGFAIPIDTINKIVPSIIRTGRYLRPGLGVVLYLDEVSLKLRLPGVLIQSVVRDGAAARAGLRPTTIASGVVTPGDSIVGIDGQAIERSADVFRILDSREIGQEVSVEYFRDGEKHSTKVTLVGVE